MPWALSTRPRVSLQNEHSTVGGREWRVPFVRVKPSLSARVSVPVQQVRVQRDLPARPHLQLSKARQLTLLTRTRILHVRDLLTHPCSGLAIRANLDCRRKIRVYEYVYE